MVTISQAFSRSNLLFTNQIQQNNASKPPVNLSFRGTQSLEIVNNALANYNKAFINFKGISQKPELTYEYLKSLTENPRDGYNKDSELRSKIGDDYYTWKYQQYSSAFADFTARMYKEAGSIDELIKFRPDWKGGKLREKFQSLHPGESFKFGNIPGDFSSKETFDQLAQTLTDAMKAQRNNVFSKNYDIPDITIGNKTFKVKALAGGKTSKVPFLVTTQDNQKFVVKIDPSPNNRVEQLESCDSVALQAMIDYYLTLNNCENSSKVYYYDEKYNVSINEYVEKDANQSELYELKRNYAGFGPKMTDLGSLGVRFNDTIGDGNVFIRNGKFVMVDNGHCTFDNPLKPAVPGFNQELPNNLQFSCFLK